jgi:LuxR family transcriptional regulator, maltose regulon positive regulatory protein
MSVTTIRPPRPVLGLRHEHVPDALAEPASAPAVRGWLTQSLVDALVRDGGGNGAAAAGALKRALDVVEREISGLLAQTETSPPVREVEPLLEPLTEGERRVLRYLPTDLSKREIADELYVSVNTVKTHVKHLYAKLDVNTRRQAVDRARVLGLVTHKSSSRPGANLSLVG